MRRGHRLSHAYSKPELARLYRSALVGAGIAWSVEALGDALVTDSAGREHRWGDVVNRFAGLHQGTKQGGAYQVGRFLGWCVREGLIDRERASALGLRGNQQ